MSSRVKPAPKHRAAAPSGAARRATARVVRRTALLTTAAAAATGVVVTGGVLSHDQVDAAVAVADLSSGIAGAQVVAAPIERPEIVSRADRRDETDLAKLEVLSTNESPARAHSEDLSDASPRTIAAAMLPEFGFSADQFGCLDSLYVSESNWRVDADNPTSSAYGIPQALTGLHDLPAGYMTSAEVQIRWGLEYIRDTYGTPCSAWEFKAGHGWY